MRLMQFVFLKNLLPRPLRRQLLGTWSRMLDGEQFLHEKHFYKQFIKSGDLVFDVGANLGMKTAAFLSLGARVIAVEPNPYCVEEIKKGNNEALANGQLKIEAVAVAATPQEVTLRIFEGKPEISSGSPVFVDQYESDHQLKSTPITVPGLTLDDLIARHGVPDFLKIDVEGMDAEVLMGLHQKPKLVSFEFNMKPTLWENTRRCFSEVERLGFTKMNITEFASPKLLLPEWRTVKGAAEDLQERFANSDHWGDIIAR